MVVTDLELVFTSPKWYWDTVRLCYLKHKINNKLLRYLLIKSCKGKVHWTFNSLGNVHGIQDIEVGE